MINLAALTGAGFVDAVLVTILAAFSQYVALRAGVFSMATAGFMAIGAYAVAILTVKYQISPVLAAICGVALATFAGAVLGWLVRKLRGAYQGIATLSFVLVLQQVISLSAVTGGPFGITGIPMFAHHSVLVASVVAVLVVVVALELSPMGRKQAAIRIDDLAAASLGTNVAAANLAAMIFSAALGGFAGAIMAGNQFAVDPTGFSFALVISTLAGVIIGGYRSFLGPIFGAFVAITLPLLFSQYQVLANIIVGLVTIIILAFAPNGLASLTRIDSEFILRLLRKAFPTFDTSIGLLSPVKGGAESDSDLVAVDIKRSYGSVRAVDGVSLNVHPGKIVGLIGPNGAGKTSVINLLAGVTALNEGRVTVGNLRIDEWPAHLVQHHGIARTFQACRLFREHTVWSNVLFAATSGRSRERRRACSDRERAYAAMKFAGCLELADRRAGDLAYAYQRRVEIARALACEPKFLLLDEPAAGMTQSESAELGKMLVETARLGIGVLVVDHNVPWILSICDTVNVQHLGQIIASGPPAAIREDPAVLAAYIGEKGAKRKVPSLVLGAVGREAV